MPEQPPPATPPKPAPEGAMKEDALALFLGIAVSHQGPFNKGRGIPPLAIADRLGLSRKRALFLFLKWGRRGWYEWGTSTATGWLTEDGWNRAMHLSGGKPTVKPLLVTPEKPTIILPGRGV